jgi:hypothetical protein
MKNVCLTLFVVLFASASFAQTNTVARWQKIVGNITAVGVDNPVAGISTGGAPWTTTGGTATVNLSTGAASFQVQGLVLNGTNASGTPGPVTFVVGTLVCNAGTATQATFSTPAVPLSPQGDAQFSGSSIGALPSPCTPLFLVRAAAASGAASTWIATGAVLTTAIQ